MYCTQKMQGTSLKLPHTIHALREHVEAYFGYLLVVEVIDQKHNVKSWVSDQYL